MPENDADAGYEGRDGASSAPYGSGTLAVSFHQHGQSTSCTPISLPVVLLFYYNSLYIDHPDNVQ